MLVEKILITEYCVVRLPQGYTVAKLIYRTTYPGEAGYMIKPRKCIDLKV